MDSAPILVLVGTKAQFIKTAPVLREMDSRGLGYRLVYTGQHSETFDLLEKTFGTRAADEVLVPDFEASTKASFTQWCFRYFREVAKRLWSRSWRGTRLGLVHGDTASTLFGAIAIRLLGAKVGHIEAGLRSNRLMDPFPEEIIRRIVSRVSSVHFVPDESSARNLKSIRGVIVNTRGNTLRDSLSIALSSMGRMPAAGGAGGYAVVSMHRNENLSNRLCFNLIMAIVQETAGILPVKFVLHPATREKLMATEWWERLKSTPNVDLMDRMDYVDFIELLLHSRMLMTDGGSNQEEAAMLGLPTLLLRKTTERMDGLDDNVVLSGLDRDVIIDFVKDRAVRAWEMRLLSSGSPSHQLVDAIERAVAET